jgi:multidrug efflux pump subunit AcrA (membrane-fusion protein)
MQPATPITGAVQKIYVHEGDAVTPGTPIALIAADTKDPWIIAKVTRQISQSVSYIETSTLHIDKYTYDVYPSYISSEATDGELYSVYFYVPDDVSPLLTNNSFISVDLPIGNPDTNGIIPFVPLDAVFKTQEETTINVVVNGVVESRKVVLGDVTGRYVTVISGLSAGDEVILDRNVIPGDEVVLN